MAKPEQPNTAIIAFSAISVAATLLFSQFHMTGNERAARQASITQLRDDRQERDVAILNRINENTRLLADQIAELRARVCK